MLQDTTWWDSLGCSGFVSAMHRLFSAKRADKWTHQLVPMKSSVTAKQSNSKSKVKCTWTLGHITRMIALTEYSIPIWLSYETWFIYIWACTRMWYHIDRSKYAIHILWSSNREFNLAISAGDASFPSYLGILRTNKIFWAVHRQEMLLHPSGTNSIIISKRKFYKKMATTTGTYDPTTYNTTFYQPSL